MGTLKGKKEKCNRKFVFAMKRLSPIFLKDSESVALDTVK